MSWRLPTCAFVGRDEDGIFGRYLGTTMAGVPNGRRRR
jgi:hypothetical protein